MESIKAYLSIIDTRLLNQITGKPRKFIELFQEQSYLSEEAFISVICDKKHNRSYYRTVKSRTKKILQILAIFSTVKGASEAKKKHDNCRKFFVAGQKFLTAGERKEGISLIKKAWRLATENDFVYLACELSSILYHDQVYYKHNSNKSKFYSAQVNKYLQAYTIEKKAEHIFYQLIEWINKSRAKTTHFRDAVHQISQLSGLSIKYKVYEATVKVLLGLHIGDKELVIHSSSSAIRFLKDKKGVYSSYNHLFLKMMGLAQLVSGNYLQAQSSLEKAEAYAPIKSPNDYALKYYKTLNALHSGEYKIAYELYQKNRRCPIKSIRDQFVIIEAYLCFLANNDLLILSKPFRLGKYLNETLEMQASKRGDNINILIYLSQSGLGIK